MQSEKLRHDAFLREIGPKRAKLEELYQAVSRATAYSMQSMAVLRNAAAPTPKQILERYEEDITNIILARLISNLYFDDIPRTINKLTVFTDTPQLTIHEYFSCGLSKIKTQKPVNCSQ